MGRTTVLVMGVGMAEENDRWRRIVAAATRPPEAAAERERAVQDALGAGASITRDSVGCSITQLRPEGFVTPAASSPLALALDHAQYEADDGPCVAACRDGTVHSIVVVGEQAGYAGFTAAAFAHDVRSSLSLPLHGTGWPSALNLYAASTSAFEDPHARDVANLMARCVAAVLPADHAPAGAARGVDADRLDAAHAVHRRVVRARAVLEARDGISSGEAFYRLTQLSVTRQSGMGAVAADVLRDATGEAHR